MKVRNSQRPGRRRARGWLRSFDSWSFQDHVRDPIHSATAELQRCRDEQGAPRTTMVLRSSTRTWSWTPKSRCWVPSDCSQFVDLRVKLPVQWLLLFFPIAVASWFFSSVSNDSSKRPVVASFNSQASQARGAGMGFVAISHWSS